MHALVAALVLWVVAAGLLTLGSTYRDPAGQLKWTDFIQFYTHGYIARHGLVSELYDPDAQYRRQVAIVPESAPERYLPVYPPQVALVFAPLANFPYLVAGTLWALLNAVTYGVTVWLAWRPVRPVLTDWALVAAAAAAFPPFWSLVLNGQTTAVPIIAFSGGAIALSRGRKVLAGAALGLLFAKPQFGLMVAVVVLTRREWSMLAGLALSGLTQLVLVAGLLGPAVLAQYLEVVPQFPALRDALEPSIEQMHSLAAVTRLLPGPLALVAWLTAGAWVSWLTVRVWRSAASVFVRMSGLIIGSVLINPHVYLYDAAVLASPLVWLSGWFESTHRGPHALRHQWRLALYALYLFLLFPTARVIGLQLSPFVLLWTLYTVGRVGVGPSLSGEDSYGAHAGQ